MERRTFLKWARNTAGLFLLDPEQLLEPRRRVWPGADFGRAFALHSKPINMLPGDVLHVNSITFGDTTRWLAGAAFEARQACMVAGVIVTEEGRVLRTLDRNELAEHMAAYVRGGQPMALWDECRLRTYSSSTTRGMGLAEYAQRVENREKRRAVHEKARA